VLTVGACRRRHMRTSPRGHTLFRAESRIFQVKSITGALPLSARDSTAGKKRGCCEGRAGRSDIDKSCRCVARRARPKHRAALMAAWARRSDWGTPKSNSQPPLKEKLSAGRLWILAASSFNEARCCRAQRTVLACALLRTLCLCAEVPVQVCRWQCRGDRRGSCRAMCRVGSR
jgi:hypothetical protein